jgi:hypothetical protein
VDAAQDYVGGEDVGDHAVVEFHVDCGKIVDVVVVASNMASSRSFQAGDCVGAAETAFGRIGLPFALPSTRLR